MNSKLEYNRSYTIRQLLDLATDLDARTGKRRRHERNLHSEQKRIAARQIHADEARGERDQVGAVRDAIGIAAVARESLVDVKRTFITGQGRKPVDIAVGDDGLELGVLPDREVLKVKRFGCVRHRQPAPQKLVIIVPRQDHCSKSLGASERVEPWLSSSGFICVFCRRGLRVGGRDNRPCVQCESVPGQGGRGGR